MPNPTPELCRHAYQDNDEVGTRKGLWRNKAHSWVSQRGWKTDYNRRFISGYRKGEYVVKVQEIKDVNNWWYSEQNT